MYKHFKILRKTYKFIGLASFSWIKLYLGLFYSSIRLPIYLTRYDYLHSNSLTLNENLDDSQSKHSTRHSFANLILCI